MGAWNKIGGILRFTGDRDKSLQYSRPLTRILSIIGLRLSNVRESWLVSRSFNRSLLKEEVDLPWSGYEVHSAHENNFCIKLGVSFFVKDSVLGVACLILAEDEGPPNRGH